MSEPVKVRILDQGAFAASVGEILLDAALARHVDLPHDCRAGSCGACRVRLVEGEVEGGWSGEPGYVLACQSKITSDIAIAVERVPAVETMAAHVSALVFRGEDVVEATIVPARPFAYMPGQYVRLRFQGLPERAFSPTVPLEGPAERETLRFHIRQVPGGRVSGALGKAIRPGHKVRLTGPFGAAWLRPGKTERLVLVSSGTGFAPIWAIAHAALAEAPDREIVMIAGSRARESIYMGESLLRVIAFPGVQALPVVSKGPAQGPFAVGSPLAFLPPLSNRDLVYVCGAPGLVGAVKDLAREQGAACFADAFEPARPEAPAGFLRRVRRLLPL